MQIAYDGFYVHIHGRNLDVHLLKLKMKRFVGESLIGAEKWDKLADWARYRKLDLATLTTASI
jgi:hypothetical protein